MLAHEPLMLAFEVLWWKKIYHELLNVDLWNLPDNVEHIPVDENNVFSFNYGNKGSIAISVKDALMALKCVCKSWLLLRLIANNSVLKRQKVLVAFLSLCFKGENLWKLFEGNHWMVFLVGVLNWSLMTETIFIETVSDMKLDSTISLSI